MIELNKIIQGDCLEKMKEIPDESIDMILCDLPYWTTSCNWDVIIPFQPLWQEYNRIIKQNWVVVLTASQPFTSDLVISNREAKLPLHFWYEQIWEKERPSNMFLMRKQPWKVHENILVFYKNQPTYNPEMTPNWKKNCNKSNQPTWNNLKYIWKTKLAYRDDWDGTVSFPRSVQSVLFDWNKDYINDWKISQEDLDYILLNINKFPTSLQYVIRDKAFHPTQKPVNLFEKMIKQFTNEGDIVLDNCAGSFTTAIACINTNRNWICMELNEEYCKLGQERINNRLLESSLQNNKKEIFENNINISEKQNSPLTEIKIEKNNESVIDLPIFQSENINKQENIEIEETSKIDFEKNKNLEFIESDEFFQEINKRLKEQDTIKFWEHPLFLSKRKHNNIYFKPATKLCQINVWIEYEPSNIPFVRLYINSNENAFNLLKENKNDIERILEQSVIFIENDKKKAKELRIEFDTIDYDLLVKLIYWFEEIYKKYLIWNNL